MADQSFLQAALSLLGRPGNAIRGGLIDGVDGIGRGLSGDRQYDGTELPGINQLSDEGPSLGPVHLSPRAIGGFAGSMLTDPLTFLGPGIVHGAVGLGGAALGMAGKGLGEELAGRALGMGSRGIAEGAGDMFSGGSRLGEALDPHTADLEDLIAHVNNKHGLNISSVPEAMASPAEHEATVATARGSLADQMMGDQHYGNVVPGRAQLPPDAEPTPLGNQKYAQGRDRLGNVQAELQQRMGDAGTAEQYLTNTSTARAPSAAGRWEDEIGVPRGTNPETVTPSMHSEPRSTSPGMDLSQGPGLGDGIDRNQILAHLDGLNKQIADLQTKLQGTGGKYGAPLQARGMENTLDDALANSNMRQVPTYPEGQGHNIPPELRQRGSDLQDQQRRLLSSSTGSKTALSPKQETLAGNRAGQQRSLLESSRQDPSLQYFGRETSPEVDMPGAGVGDSGASHVSQGPHGLQGDSLEEDRAVKATEDKFGRKGAGTFQGDEMLGMDDNRRGYGAGGAGPMTESRPSTPPGHEFVDRRQQISEPTAGHDSRPTDIGQELIGLRHATAMRHAQAAAPSTSAAPINQYLRYLMQRNELPGG